MHPNLYLVGTSVLFSLPTTFAAYHQQWYLYFSFLFITLSSSLYHATKNKYLLLVDYPACYNLIICLYFYTKKLKDRPIFAIASGSCAILFWGGYLTDHLVFSRNSTEQTVSHVTMHIVVIFSGIATSHLTFLLDKNNRLLCNG